MITLVLVSIATALVVVCCVGVCGIVWAWNRYLGRRQVNARLSVAPRHPDPSAHREVMERPETGLETLQRRFISGQITLDEYERDIDRLHRKAEPA